MNNTTIVFLVHLGGRRQSNSYLRSKFAAFERPIRAGESNYIWLICDRKMFNVDKVFAETLPKKLPVRPSKRITYIPRFLLEHIVPDFNHDYDGGFSVGKGDKDGLSPNYGGVLGVKQVSKYSFSPSEEGRHFFVSGNLHASAPDNVEGASKLVASDIVENIFKVVESDDCVVVDLFAELFLVDIDMTVFVRHLREKLIEMFVPPLKSPRL